MFSPTFLNVFYLFRKKKKNGKNIGEQSFVRFFWRENAEVCRATGEIRRNESTFNEILIPPREILGVIEID